MQHPYPQLFSDLAQCFAHLGEKREDILAQINSAGRLRPDEALEVYRRAYVARLTEALGEKYTRVWRFLGDDEFFKYTYPYIRANPSQVFDLGHYGDTFPEFLRQHLPEDEKFLVDLAIFDRTYLEVFHLPEKRFDSVASFQGEADLENASLELAPSLRVFASDFDTFKIWQAIKSEEWDPEYLEPRRSFALLQKHDSKVYIQPVTEALHRLVSALQKQPTLSQAMALLEEEAGQLSLEEIQSSVSALVSQNLVAVSRENY